MNLEGNERDRNPLLPSFHLLMDCCLVIFAFLAVVLLFFFSEEKSEAAAECMVVRICRVECFN